MFSLFKLCCYWSLLDGRHCYNDCYCYSLRFGDRCYNGCYCCSLHLADHHRWNDCLTLGDRHSCLWNLCYFTTFWNPHFLGVRQIVDFHPDLFHDLHVADTHLCSYRCDRVDQCFNDDFCSIVSTVNAFCFDFLMNFIDINQILILIFASLLNCLIFLCWVVFETWRY